MLQWRFDCVRCALLQGGHLVRSTGGIEVTDEAFELAEAIC
jgi:hypothetical protein